MAISGHTISLTDQVKFKVKFNQVKFN
jgi:hypothetical protein